MGSEAGLRNTLKNKLKQHCHYERIENKAGVGTPDVNIAHLNNSCWIELKYLTKFPVRAKTTVKLKRFTKEQALWLMTRWAHKPGGSWLLVQVGQEYYLFKGMAVWPLHLGEWTSLQFIQKSVHIFNRGFSPGEFLDVIFDKDLTI